MFGPKKYHKIIFLNRKMIKRNKKNILNHKLRKNLLSQIY